MRFRANASQESFKGFRKFVVAQGAARVVKGDGQVGVAVKLFALVLVVVVAFQFTEQRVDIFFLEHGHRVGTSRIISGKIRGQHR